MGNFDPANCWWHQVDGNFMWGGQYPGAPRVMLLASVQNGIGSSKLGLVPDHVAVLSSASGPLWAFHFYGADARVFAFSLESIRCGSWDFETYGMKFSGGLTASEMTYVKSFANFAEYEGVVGRLSADQVRFVLIRRGACRFWLLNASATDVGLAFSRMTTPYWDGLKNRCYKVGSSTGGPGLVLQILNSHRVPNGSHLAA